MKVGVTGFPPLTYRMICLLIGTPVLGLVLLFLKVPFKVPRQYWKELLILSVFNMFFWHILIILAVSLLSSGRSAILGYTMPIFSALIGAIIFKTQLSKRNWTGVTRSSHWCDFFAVA
jgi:drug/metabolite transporter (DMT)-like permease